VGLIGVCHIDRVGLIHVIVYIGGVSRYIYRVGVIGLCHIEGVGLIGVCHIYRVGLIGVCHIEGVGLIGVCHRRDRRPNEINHQV
jgi:hypothetical protein